MAALMGAQMKLELVGGEHITKAVDLFRQAVDELGLAVAEADGYRNMPGVSSLGNDAESLLEMGKLRDAMVDVVKQTALRCLIRYT